MLNFQGIQDPPKSGSSKGQFAKVIKHLIIFSIGKSWTGSWYESEINEIINHATCSFAWPRIRMCYNNVLQCANGKRNQDGARGGQSVEHCHTDTTTLLHWDICYIF